MKQLQKLDLCFDSAKKGSLQRLNYKITLNFHNNNEPPLFIYRMQSATDNSLSTSIDDLFVLMTENKFKAAEICVERIDNVMHLIKKEEKVPIDNIYWQMNLQLHMREGLMDVNKKFALCLVEYTDLV